MAENYRYYIIVEISERYNYINICLILFTRVYILKDFVHGIG